MRKQLIYSICLIGLLLNVSNSYAQIAILSGDGQSGEINTTLSAPLVITINCGSGTSPFPCATINWSSNNTGDTFSASGGDTFSPNPSQTVGSDPGSAQASTILTLGPTPGTRTIRAVSIALEDLVEFTITATEPSTPDPGGDEQSQIEAEQQAQQQTALQQTATAPGVTLVNAVNGNVSMQRHVSNFHGGGSPKNLDLSGLNFSIDGTTITAADIQHWLQSGSGQGAGDPLDFLGERLGFFINGNFSFGDRPTTARESGLDFRMLGTTLGMDLWLLDNLYTGIAFGYTGTDNDFVQSAGGTDINTYNLNVYATWSQPNSFYADFLFRYGWSDYEVRRNFTSLGGRESAQAEYDGTDYSFAVNGGYNFVIGQATLQPYGRFEYVAVDTDAYQERAASSGATPSLMGISQQNLQSLRTAVGGRAMVAISTGIGVFQPIVHAEWVHEFKNHSRTLTSTLINVPGAAPLTMLTDAPDRNFVNIGGSVTGTFARGFSGFLSYEALIGNRLLFQNTFNIGLRIEL